ncbi:MAG: FxsA family protein, partial [Dermatophilaceae bacterium]
MAPRVATTPSVRRRRWPWVLVVLLLVVPTLEIAVIIAVGKVIGAWPTLLLLVAESALGA